MINNIITSFFFGMFIMFLINSLTQVAYNLKRSKDTEVGTFIVPAIFAACFWFCLHL